MVEVRVVVTVTAELVLGLGFELGLRLGMWFCLRCCGVVGTG